MAKRFELWFGSFDNEDFVWKTLSSHETFDDCYRAYHKLCVECVGMDKDELYDKYKSTRIDIEIRDGKKRLNWCGLYQRKADKTIEEEEDEDESKDEEEKSSE
jgi:hypothetical protein